MECQLSPASSETPPPPPLQGNTVHLRRRTHVAAPPQQLFNHANNSSVFVFFSPPHLIPPASPRLNKLATPAALIAPALSSYTRRRAVFSRAAVRSRCMRRHQIANRRRWEAGVKSTGPENRITLWQQKHWTENSTGAGSISPGSKILFYYYYYWFFIFVGGFFGQGGKV